MLVCSLDGDLYPPLEEPTGTADGKSKKKDKDKDKKFVWNHGSKWMVTILAYGLERTIFVL